jgi:hypothetical protein
MGTEYYLFFHCLLPGAAALSQPRALSVAGGCAANDKRARGKIGSIAKKMLIATAMRLAGDGRKLAIENERKVVVRRSVFTGL